MQVLNPKINTVTNILAIVSFFIEPIRAYLMSQEFNWQTFAICIVTTVVAYFSGKK